jgi:hypothetical protein
MGKVIPGWDAFGRTIARRYGAVFVDGRDCYDNRYRSCFPKREHADVQYCKSSAWNPPSDQLVAVEQLTLLLSGQSEIIL